MQEQLTQRDFSKEYDESYQKYDFIVNLFQLGRDQTHRRKALQLAGLKKNDIVLDICCGTGLSLKAIRSIIGPEGKIIGVDANKQMLGIAKERVQKNNWQNVQLIEADIDALDIEIKADVVLFALCWYDRETCTRWVQKISKFLKPDTGRFCFIDYKFPENWVRHIATPVLSVLVKWLGEAYNVDDLKWDPRMEIGNLLNDPLFKAYYFDSIFTIAGKPK